MTQDAPAGEQQGQTAEQQAAAAAAGAGAGAGAVAGQQAAGEQQQGQQGDDNPWADPEKAKREIERLRRENGDERINAKKAAADEARKELLTTLAKVLDPEGTGKEEATVEQVSAQLQATAQEREQARAEADEARREATLTRQAWLSGVNPSKLDYLVFQLTRRSDLKDVPLEEYGDKVKAAITDEVAKDSSLKLSGAAVGTGAEQFGGAGSATAMTKEQFRALPVGEMQKLYRDNPAEYTRLSAL